MINQAKSCEECLKEQRNEARRLELERGSFRDQVALEALKIMVPVPASIEIVQKSCIESYRWADEMLKARSGVR